MVVAANLELLSQLFDDCGQDLADPGLAHAQNLADLLEIELFDIV